MNKLFAAFAAVMLATIVPAWAAAPTPVARNASAAPATAFSALTTIYVASGVLDAGANNAGHATAVHCSNISGTTVQVRVLFYNSGGVVVGTNAPVNLSYTESRTFVTHAVAYFAATVESTGGIVQGLLAVQSTNSAVFCSAMIVGGAGPVANGIDLHMVRFNAHPGTVE